jgi:sugar lactone lactonase YvrE
MKLSVGKAIPYLFKPMKPALLLLMSGLCATKLMAQPTITNQPSGQVALPGGTVAFSVSATGDGGTATNAIVYRPFAVAVDGAGNLFVVENGNNRIRKVGLDGITTTVAGTGTAGYSGDGGPATNAGVPYPVDVAVDATGNLYISGYNPGYNNHRIRRVGTNGIITVVAGTGTAGYSGDGGPATNAMLNYPQGLAVDAAGNLFIAESKRIRRVGTNGIITTVAGNGTNGFTGDGGLATNTTVPCWGVAASADGSFFVADYATARIRKVDANGIITTVAGNASQNSTYAGNGCAALNARLNYPAAVAVDPAGNLFITDGGNLRVRRVDTNQIITTVAGNGLEGFAGDGGPAIEAKLYEPGGLAANAAGHLFIADSRNYCVRIVSPEGLITTVAGRGSHTPYDGIVATNAQLDNPDSVTLDATGNLVFSDYNTIRKLCTNGLLTRLAGTGYTGYAGDGGVATLAMLYSPSGVAVDPAGNVFITDTGNQRIRRVDSNGVITTVAGKGTYGYAGDGGTATNAQFYNPGGLAVNAAGDLFIADSLNHRIRKVDAQGVITTVAGNGTNGYVGDGGSAIQAKISMPTGLALDAAGNLFIADYGNHRIRKVSPFASLPTLTLNNVTTNHAGDYRVIVTGASGSVTSIVATLTVVLGRPALTLTRNGTNLLLSFPSQTGASYQLQSATNLPAATWLNEGPPFPGTGGVLMTNLPIGPAPAKFFRLQSPGN